jgi:hypothetical protein
VSPGAHFWLEGVLGGEGEWKVRKHVVMVASGCKWKGRGDTWQEIECGESALGKACVNPSSPHAFPTLTSLCLISPL